ncbi:glutathione S-transferase epsilon 6 isoform X1 [Phthorimaea operculella]|nr:glutathione S-transferase epsilon 6 isoform X1 [Phthorimaea operculella]
MVKVFWNGLTLRRLSKKMATKPQLTLWKMAQSPPARAVMMTLDLLGLDVKMEELNPITREQDTPEFTKMNPMKTVPILNDGDFGLGDSHAIMIYLIEKYGKAEHAYLYPKDVRKRAVVNHLLFFECGILFPRLRAIMAPTYHGRLTELSKYMKINMEDAYDKIEVYLSENKFVAGDGLTIADLSVYTTVQTMVTMHPAGDENRWAKFRRWFKTMSDLDVVRRVNEPGGSMHGATLLKIMEINKERQQTKAKL